MGLAAVKFFDLKNKRNHDIDLGRKVDVDEAGGLTEDTRRALKEAGIETSKDIARAEKIQKRAGLSAAEAQAAVDWKDSLGIDWDRYLKLTGDTGPYLQYTCARIAGILRKLGADVRPDADVSLLIETEAQELIRLLPRFKERVARAAEECEPSLIAQYLLELARATSSFIQQHHVLRSEPEVRDARALLLSAARDVLAAGLSLLGIEALERM